MALKETGQEKQRPISFVEIKFQRNLLLFIVLFLLSCALTSRHPEFLIDETVQNRLDSDFHDWSNEPIIVLADSTIIDFKPNSKQSTVDYSSTVWYYINKRNPTILENISVSDFETYERKPVITATVFYPDGKMWVAPKSSIVRFRSSIANAFSSNCQIQQFFIPKYQQGCLIRLSVIRKYHRSAFFTKETVRSNFPVLERYVNLRFPKKVPLNYYLANDERLALDTHRIEDQDAVSFTVKAKKIHSLESIKKDCLPDKQYAELFCSFPPRGEHSYSWKELGDYYLDLIKKSFNGENSRLHALAVSVPENVNTDSIVVSMMDLVRKKIRYHAELENLRAIIPDPVSLTLANGYSDCKGTSALLVSLLKLKGVKCGLALVATPGYACFRENVPSLGFFNHVITYYYNNDGELCFVDPTVRYGNPLDSYIPLLNQKLLCLKEQSGFIETIIGKPNCRNGIITESTVKECDSGLIQQGTIYLPNNHSFLLYPHIKSLGEQEYLPFLKKLLKNGFGIETQDAAFEYCRPDSIKIKYSTSIKKNRIDLGKGGLLITVPKVFGHDMRTSLKENEGFFSNSGFTQTDSWALPSEYIELDATVVDTECCTGSWKLVHSQKLQRKYVQNRTGWISGTGIECNEQMQKFSKASLWR